MFCATIINERKSEIGTRNEKRFRNKKIRDTTIMYSLTIKHINTHLNDAKREKINAENYIPKMFSVCTE